MSAGEFTVTEVEFTVRPPEGVIFGPLALAGQVGRTVTVAPGLRGTVTAAVVAPDRRSATLRLDVPGWDVRVEHRWFAVAEESG